MTSALSSNQSDDFKDKVCKEAEGLVNDFFPSKVAELDALLGRQVFHMSNLSKVRQATAKTLENLKLYAKDGENEEPIKPDVIFSTNEYIVKMMDMIKPQIVELLEATGTLRVWVVLLIPKIEDGNNFGVEVQEETLGELRVFEQELAGNQEQIANYFLARAKVVSQISKRPGVKDYARFITEEDEKQFVGLRLMVAELRNSCSSIHDLIMKNKDKITTPRGQSNFSSIY